MSRLEELKKQRAQLDELIRSGVLTGDAATQARDRLEAEIVAAVAPAAATTAGTSASTSASRSAAAEPAARPSPRLLLGLLAFLLVFAAAGYAWLGNPAGLAVAPGSPGPALADGQSEPSHAEFEAMAARLAERLKTTPDDVEGWTMLGRSYSVLERFPQALEAFRRVLALKPQDAQAMVDVADALAMVNGRKLDGEPEALIAKALAIDPDNLKALGLAGTIAFQRGDAATAAKHWERAVRAAPPGSEMASRLQAALDEARQRAGLPPLQNAAPATAAAPAPDTRPADGAAAGAASVQVRITLAPALAAKASPDDTLFVFARAPQGGKAPLAIQRRQVKDLPLDVTLDDSMAMSPAMRLSSVPQVIVGARISKSGNAMPQPGDLQGLSPVVPVGTQGLALQIAEVLP
jgi:cytochrome c-type biogenesis protein CcmH